jgi:predicted aspartyl protease
MMHGLVNINYEPVLRLEIEDGQGQVHKMDVVINTGFSGFLGLPYSLIADLNLVRSPISEESYEATIIWNEEYQQIVVTPVETEPIIGIALLEGYTLQIQVMQHGLVTLERVD